MKQFLSLKYTNLCRHYIFHQVKRFVCCKLLLSIANEILNKFYVIKFYDPYSDESLFILP